MPFIPANGCAKVAIEASAGGVPIVNTLWFLQPTNYSQADLTNLVNGVANWIDSSFRAVMPTLWVVDSITAYAMDSASSPKYTGTPILGGLLAGSIGSYQDVLAISFKTANRGRGARGGNRVSPILESQLEDNVVTPAHRAGVTASYGVLNGSVQASAPLSTHVVVSFYDNGVPRSAGLPQQVLTYDSVTGFVRTQKSRRE